MNDSKPTFKEINESYTLKEAIAEAKRCLNCKHPSCKKGCPIENDIPEFIHELSKGNMGNAMAIINEKVIFRLFAAVSARMKNSVRDIACSIRKGKVLKSGSWNASSPILIRR